MKECVATRGLVVGNEAYMSAVPILKGFSLVLVLLGDTVLVVLNDVDAGDAAIFMAQHHILLVHHLDDVLVCIHHTAGRGGEWSSSGGPPSCCPSPPHWGLWLASVHPMLTPFCT